MEKWKMHCTTLKGLTFAEKNEFDSSGFERVRLTAAADPEKQMSYGTAASRALSNLRKHQ
jgi:hypothetical protein